MPKVNCIKCEKFIDPKNSYKIGSKFYCCKNCCKGKTVKAKICKYC